MLPWHLVMLIFQFLNSYEGIYRNNSFWFYSWNSTTHFQSFFRNSLCSTSNRKSSMETFFFVEVSHISKIITTQHTLFWRIFFGYCVGRCMSIDRRCHSKRKLPDSEYNNSKSCFLRNQPSSRDGVYSWYAIFGRFIVGGGFVTGESSAMAYWPNILATTRNNTIVVTLNYRLGPLGFLVLIYCKSWQSGIKWACSWRWKWFYWNVKLLRIFCIEASGMEFLIRELLWCGFATISVILEEIPIE